MKILYNQNDSLKIITLPENANREIAIILGEKDIPYGLLFKIVRDSDLPSDRKYRNAWECPINESDADGKGLSPEEFYKKYPRLKWMYVK